MAAEACSSATEGIVLLGMMYSGKTSTAEQLAKLAGMHWFDTDRVLEESAGMGIAEIWHLEGEAGFRAREAQVVAALLSSQNVPMVVSTGGGILLNPGVVPKLKQLGTTVYLRASWKTLARRAEEDANSMSTEVARGRVLEDRPLLQEAAGAGSATLGKEIRGLLDARADAYESAAEIVVDVDGAAPADVALAIMDAVERTPA